MKIRFYSSSSKLKYSSKSNSIGWWQVSANSATDFPPNETTENQIGHRINVENFDNIVLNADAHKV